MTLLSTATTWGAALPAECTTAKPGTVTVGESIALVPSPDVPARLLNAAIDLWAACANYGAGFPSLSDGGSGTRVIRVALAPSPVGRRCGSFAGNLIRLHAVARDLGHAVPCLAPERILAHEIGHALGLADAPAVDSCRDHIMAPTFREHERGRQVQPSECQAVGQRWLTPAEHRVQERLVVDWAAAGSGEEDP